MSNFKRTHPDAHCVLTAKGVVISEIKMVDHSKIRSAFANICMALRHFLHVGGEESPHSMRITIGYIALTLEASLAMPLPIEVLDQVCKEMNKIVTVLSKYIEV